MHANLSLFDGKFNVHRLRERWFDLVFRDRACAAKRMECSSLTAFSTGVGQFKPPFRGKF